VYWEAQAPFTWGGAMAVSGELNVELSKFKLVGTKKNNDKEYFETITFFSDLSNSGTYPMTANHDKVMGYRDYYEKNCFIYYYDTLNSGTLNISTLDKNKRIIQGTFSMTLKNPDYGADSLMHITSGKFMFNY